MVGVIDMEMDTLTSGRQQWPQRPAGTASLLERMWYNFQGKLEGWEVTRLLWPVVVLYGKSTIIMGLRSSWHTQGSRNLGGQSMPYAQYSALSPCRGWEPSEEHILEVFRFSFSIVILFIFQFWTHTHTYKIYFFIFLLIILLYSHSPLNFVFPLLVIFVCMCVCVHAPVCGVYVSHCI